MIYMLFFVHDAFTMIYYAIYFFAMPMEIFPSCYYGTKMCMELGELTRALFDCNWQTQNMEFRQNLRIFVEQTLRPIHIEAGGMVRVNMSAFLASCKLAYSLYSVVMRLN